MDARRLQRTADDLVRRHGPKLARGLDSAEKFAKKRAKGREGQVDRVANTLRGVLAKQRRPR